MKMITPLRKIRSRKILKWAPGTQGKAIPTRGYFTQSKSNLIGGKSSYLTARNHVIEN